MKKLNKRQMILIGVLVLAWGYWLISKVFKPSKVVETIRNPAEAILGIQQGDELAEIKKYTTLASVVEIEWPGKWQKDPFFLHDPRRGRKGRNYR